MKYQINRSWPIAATFAWAILWRSMVLSIPIGLGFGLIFEFLTPSQSETLSAIRSIVEIFIGFVVVTIACYWVLGRGYSSKKIILMEHADYQKFEDE